MKQVKNWIMYQKFTNSLMDMALMEFRETDTMISDIHTISKDVNLAEFMHKIGGVYQE